MIRCTLLCSALLAAPLAARAGGASVVTHKRLGNNAEDGTYVASGRHAGKFAVLDGYDVIGVRLHGLGEPVRGPQALLLPRGAEVLFNIKSLNVGGPRGMEYVPTLRQFVFSSVNNRQENFLYPTDESGNALPPLPVAWPAGVNPATDFQDCEGLGYIPAGAPHFPDHLVLISNRNAGPPNFVAPVFEFINPHTGAVDGELTLPAPDPNGDGSDQPLSTYLTAVNYLAPDRLVVSPTSNQLWIVNFDGTTSGPIYTDAAARDIESVAQLHDGQLAYADYGNGSVVTLDPATWTATSAHDFHIGIGLTAANGISWDPDAGRFITEGQLGAPQFRAVVGLSAALDAAQPIIDVEAPLPVLANTDGVLFNPASASYLPATHQILIADQGGFERGLYFFDAQGNYQSRVVVRSLAATLGGVATHPGSAVVLADGSFLFHSPQADLRDASGNITAMRLVHAAPGGPLPAFENDPTGVFAANGSVLTLDRLPDAGGLALAGGNLLIGDALFDQGGHFIGGFNVADVGGVANGTARITSGPMAGQWATTDASESSVTIFNWTP